MLGELSKLPVVCEMAADESALGFLLRCARANGMALKQLMTLAGVTSPTWPRPLEIERLAYLVDESPVRLAQALRQRASRSGRREFEFAAHRWMSVTALRVRDAQVCPLCLRERGYCRAVWELTGFCACAEHGCRLSDRCGHCGGVIDWSRPAVDVCRCGHYLIAPEAGESVPEGVGVWCRWLQHQCAEPFSNQQVLSGEFRWLSSAGPDAAFHILMAFGVKRDPSHHRSGSDTARTPGCEETMASLDRALARLVSVDHADAPLPLEIVRVIDEPRLERLAHFGVTEAGRRIARQLLRRIRDRSRLAPVRPTRRVGMAFKGQLDLFADGEAHAS